MLPKRRKLINYFTSVFVIFLFHFSFSPLFASEYDFSDDGAWGDEREQNPNLYAITPETHEPSVNLTLSPEPETGTAVKWPHAPNDQGIPEGPLLAATSAGEETVLETQSVDSETVSAIDEPADDNSVEEAFTAAEPPVSEGLRRLFETPEVVWDERTIKQPVVDISVDPAAKQAVREKVQAALAATPEEGKSGVAAVLKLQPLSAEIKQQIPDLINQLGNNEYQVREDATQKLRELGKDVIPALKAAQLDPDLEVGSRARRVLKRLESEAAEGYLMQKGEQLWSKLGERLVLPKDTVVGMIATLSVGDPNLTVDITRALLEPGKLDAKTYLQTATQLNYLQSNLNADEDIDKEAKTRIGNLLSSIKADFQKQLENSADLQLDVIGIKDTGARKNITDARSKTGPADAEGLKEALDLLFQARTNAGNGVALEEISKTEKQIARNAVKRITKSIEDSLDDRVPLDATGFSKTANLLREARSQIGSEIGPNLPSNAPERTLGEIWRLATYDLWTNPQVSQYMPRNPDEELQVVAALERGLQIRAARDTKLRNEVLFSSNTDSSTRLGIVDEMVRSGYGDEDTVTRLLAEKNPDNREIQDRAMYIGGAMLKAEGKIREVFLNTVNSRLDQAGLENGLNIPTHVPSKIDGYSLYLGYITDNIAYSLGSQKPEIRDSAFSALNKLTGYFATAQKEHLDLTNAEEGLVRDLIDFRRTYRNEKSEDPVVKTYLHESALPKIKATAQSDPKYKEKIDSLMENIQRMQEEGKWWLEPEK